MVFIWKSLLSGYDKSENNLNMCGYLGMIVQVSKVAVPMPEPERTRRCTKAVAVLVLAIIGLFLAPAVGGLVAAATALILADQAQADIVSSAGFLTGEQQLRYGRRLAWIAVWVSIIAAVVLSVFLLLQL
jgi:hypothetical protein